MHFPASIITDDISAFAAVAVPMTVVILGIFNLMLDRNNSKLIKDLDERYVQTKVADLKYALKYPTVRQWSDHRKVNGAAVE